MWKHAQDWTALAQPPQATLSPSEPDACVVRPLVGDEGGAVNQRQRDLDWTAVTFLQPVLARYIMLEVNAGIILRTVTL